MPQKESSRVPTDEVESCFSRHFRFGWWALCLFLTLGLILEALHGFKIGWYLNVGNEVRRLMLTLAHTHGTLLAIVNIAFSLSLRIAGDRLQGATRFASPCLLAATVLLPSGFLLGGIIIHPGTGDPGLGILLVPVGGLILLFGVLSIAINASRAPQSLGSASDSKQNREH